MPSVDEPNECTGLLTPTSETRSKHQKRTATPLALVQIWVVLLLQVVEPITGRSIYPYINQLISELDITGGDEKRVGYYAGLIESLCYAAEAITVLQWSRLSDSIGRKPVLLIGLLGTTLSMLCFGLSRTFWALVLSRCLTGLLNGNTGVMKSVMGDLTDSSNRAEGLGLIPAIWSCGAAIGPVIGGTFARPHERFPSVFNSWFWIEYPYFLPCLISAVCAPAGFLLILFVFKESSPRRQKYTRLVSEDSIETLVSYQHSEPVPLRGLFVYPVILSISNFVAHAFLNISFEALFPLFCAMPRKIGGLGVPPSTIGYIMGTYGAVSGIFQFFFFAKVIRFLGERRVFLNGMMLYPVVFALFPVISLCAGMWVAWGGIAVIIISQVFMDMAFGAIIMFLTASAPNKASLGATNGLSQTVVAISRAIGPAFATSLFSVSVEHNILLGYGVYALFFTISVFALFLAIQLPEEVWEEND